MSANDTGVQSPSSTDISVRKAQKANGLPRQFGIWLNIEEREPLEKAKAAYMAEHGLTRLTNADYVRRLAHTPSIELHAEDDVVMFDRLRSDMSPGIARLTKAGTLHKLLRLVDLAFWPARTKREGKAHYAALEELMDHIPDAMLHAEVQRRARRVMTPGVSELHQRILGEKKTYMPKPKVKSPRAATLRPKKKKGKFKP